MQSEFVHQIVFEQRVHESHTAGNQDRPTVLFA